MCEGCPLQTLADAFPHAQTTLSIWHEKTGQPDHVTLALTHDGERFSVKAATCRLAVKEILAEMDATRIGDCRAVMVE